MEGSMVMASRWGRGVDGTRRAAWRRAGEAFVAVLLACLLGVNMASAAAPGRVLLVMGDSLSAGYNLAADEGWVSLLARRLEGRDPAWTVVNASISGETTAGGAARIDAELATHRPALVVIELGANDGLRGLPMEQARANLARMIAAAQAAGAKVLLVGMEMPPNYGPDYTAQFRGMFRELADTHRIPLLPFLLEPIARERDAFQADNLHPVAAVQPRILAHVWPALEPLLGAP
jgi:acyl-CoA thioesterase-1